jgi:regulator of protease activity HflC (stomatin/prohibitin superfamily)
VIDYCSCGEFLISQAPVTWDALLRAGVTGVVFFATTANNRVDFEDAIKPTDPKSSMTRSEKLIFWGGIYFLVFLFSVVSWFVLAFLAWYVKRIPERRLPMTSLLTGNQQKFYDWLSDFLWSWLRSSVSLTVTFWIIEFVLGAFLLSVVRIAEFPLADLLMNPIFLVLVAYLTAVIAILYSLDNTIFLHWKALFWQAEPAARLLVGNENYDIMTDAEKESVKRNVVDSQVGINKATIVVAGGKIQTLNPPAGNLARFGGPGVLIVQEGHAVVLERGGRRSRIVGTGVWYLGMFERINTIIPLAQRTVNIEVENVVTEDHVLVDKIRLLAFTRLDPGDKSHKNGDYPFDDKVINDLVWSPKLGPEVYDWSSAVKSVADTAIRDMVARLKLDELILASGQARDTLRTNLKDAINRITKDKLGVAVSSVVIGEVVIPDEARQKLLERWLMDWEAQIAQVRATVTVSQAEADKRAHIARGEGEREYLRKQGEGKALAVREENLAKAEGESEIIRQFLLALAQLPINEERKADLVKTLLQGEQYRDAMRMWSSMGRAARGAGFRNVDGGDSGTAATEP